MTRRRVAATAAGLLLVLVLASQPLSELPRRLRTLIAFAPKELAVRRLGGSGTASDRRFFSFLENARRRIPPGTPGVVVAAAGGGEPATYLATYWLAPVPVLDAGALTHGVPPGWITAAYGDPASVGSEAPFARLPEGALYGPSPGQGR
ncbi:MAG TPA: hypothetical protein VGG65_06915 [Thermoanaerobaculia bacterium]